MFLSTKNLLDLELFVQRYVVTHGYNLIWLGSGLGVVNESSMEGSGGLNSSRIESILRRNSCGVVSSVAVDCA